MPDLNKQLSNRMLSLNILLRDVRTVVPDATAKQNVATIEKNLKRQIVVLNRLDQEITPAEFGRVKSNIIKVDRDMARAMDYKESESVLIGVVNQTVELINGGGFVQEYTCPGPPNHTIASPRCRKHRGAKPYPKAK